MTSLYGSPPSSVVLCIHNNDIMTRINSLYGSQALPVVLCIQNSVISTRNTSLHGSQTSPVVLGMQNNVISIRISSLYGSQPSSVVFECKTATLGPNYKSLCPRPRLSICAWKTQWLELKLLVSMRARPHRRFVHAKQHDYHQNYQSLWVPSLICGFCMQNSDFGIRITSLYGCHPSPVVLCMHNSVISTRKTSVHGSQTSTVVLCM